jgi:cell division protein FtsA
MSQETIAGLDIGTTKTCAVVAVSGPDGLEIIGIGEAPSSGLRRGIVVDLDETVRSIEAAAERAERMAGRQLSDVYVGVTGEHIKSRNHRATVILSDGVGEVEERDVARVVSASRQLDVGFGRRLIHAIPRHYAIDGHAGVIDPVGMFGARLELDSHIVTGGTTFISTLLKCVLQAGLEPAGIVFEPLASATATLLREEMQAGVALLDIGGGTTDIAVYSGGAVVHTGTLPLGGNSLTSDIALGLGTSFAEAESVKREYGSLADDPALADVTFMVRSLDARTLRTVAASRLRAIVAPRMEEIFRLAKANIAANGAPHVALHEVVLTGGGALIDGVEPAAADFFGVPARVGVPAPVPGLTDVFRQPQFSTAVGLVLFGPTEDAATRAGKRRRHANVLSKVAAWVGDLWN